MSTFQPARISQVGIRRALWALTAMAVLPSYLSAQELPKPQDEVLSPLADTILDDDRITWRLQKDTPLTVLQSDPPYVVASIPGTQTRGRVHLNQVDWTKAKVLGQGPVSLVHMMRPQMDPDNPLLFLGGGFPQRARALLASGRGVEIIATKDGMLTKLSGLRRNPIGPLWHINYLGIVSDAYRTVGDRANAIAYLQTTHQAARQLQRDIDAGRYGPRLPAPFKLDCYRKMASVGWAETMYGRLAAGEAKLAEGVAGIDSLLPDKNLDKVYLPLQYAVDGHSHTQHAGVLLRLGQIAAAKQALHRALELNEGARKYYETADIDASGSYGDTEALLAVLHASAGRIDEAIESMDVARHRRHRHAVWTGHVNNPHQEILVREENEPYMRESLDLAISVAMRRARHDAEGTPVAEMAANWVLNAKLMTEYSLSKRMQEVRRAQLDLPGASSVSAPFGLMGKDRGSLATNRNVYAMRGLAANFRLRALDAGERDLARQEFETLRFIGHGLMATRVPDVSPPAGVSYQNGKIRKFYPNKYHDELAEKLWVDAVALREHLTKGQVLIEFLRYRDFDVEALEQGQFRWNPDRYAAWIIPREGKVAQVDLGEADAIDTALAEWAEALRADRDEILKRKRANRVQAKLAALRELLIDPLRDTLNEKRSVILCPDGELWNAPWAALPWSNDKFLLEQFSIHLVSAGRSLAKRNVDFKYRAARAKKQSENEEGDPLPVPPVVGPPLILADPNFDAKPAEIEEAEKKLVAGAGAPPLVAVVRRGSSVLPPVARLASTRAEAKDIVPALEKYCGQKPELLMDDNALELAVVDRASPKVLVLATHGFFLPQNHPLIAGKTLPIRDPTMRCGLLLAGCNRSDDWLVRRAADGVLSGYEVAALDLRGTELVVLSACETALGDAKYGEGVAGLRQAFQIAGAKSVVASLWQIPDSETAIIMVKFFENLAAGQAKSDALRNAQLARIKERRERYNGDDHPFHWAALTLTE